jgi:protein-disulfide isomerase
MTEENEISKKRVKVFSNYWVVSTFVLAILLIGVIIYGNSFRGSVVSANVVSDKVISFANSQGVDAEIVSVESNGSLYEVVLSIEGEEFPLYVTLDGKSIISGLVPLEVNEVSTPATSTSTEIPKSDKPILELFVMTHCPYGTQAEKGFLPMARLLEDVADMEIRFVHYFMHEPEETETPRQVCIREEQGDKFLDYLECFLEGDGNSEGGYIQNGNDPSTCMQETGVDESLVEECVDSGRWEDYYAEDSEMSEDAGVRGSPTLVINGAIVEAGRSESAYLGASCEAFNEVPELCEEEVSTAQPSVYFGWEETSNTASAAGAC